MARRELITIDPPRTVEDKQPLVGFKGKNKKALPIQIKSKNQQAVRPANQPQNIVQAKTETPNETAGQAVTPQATQERIQPQTVTPEQIQQQIADAKKQAAVRQFETQLEQARGRFQQEREQAQQGFQEAGRQLNVQDTMSRRAQDVREAEGGLAQSGFRGQSDISQNVLTQGATGRLEQQRQSQLGDIGRRETETEALGRLGLAQEQSAADLEQLSSQLRGAEAQEERDFILTRDEQGRAFELGRDEANREFTRERDQYATRTQEERDRLLNGFENERIQIQDELQRAREDRNFAREKELMRLQQRNAISMEGVRAANQEARDTAGREFTAGENERDRAFNRERDNFSRLTQLERDERLNEFQVQDRELQAEIQRARDEQNFVREKDLMQAQADNSIRLEAIRSANDMAQIGARGAQDRATAQFRADLEPAQQQQTVDIKSFQSGLDRIADSSVNRDDITGQTTPNEARRQQASAELIMRSIINGQMDDDTARSLITSYGISAQALEQAERILSGDVPLNP